MERSSVLTACIISSWLLTSLQAVKAPKFSHSPEPIVAPIGDEVEFECTLDYPAEQIRWKHNKKFLTDTFFNASKSQLIFKVKEDKVGEYQCVAWYGASAIASTPARLTLATFGPTTPSFHRKLIVTTGNNVVINCSVPLSNPPAGIQYYKNNNPLNGGVVLPSGSLLLTNVSQSDSGQYSCSATNTYVLDEPRYIPSYHNLNVVSGQRDKRPPEVTFPPPSLHTVLIGTNVTLECVGFGEPVPAVSWRRPEGRIQNPRANQNPAGLFIQEVRPSDEGVYICDISNGIHPSLSFRISLIILEPPSVVKGPDDLSAKEGGRASLDCTVRGKPTPNIEWLLNGNIISNDSNVRVYGGRLDLDRVEKRHAGWYQCMAQNDVGATFATSLLLVVPRQVTVNNSEDLPVEPTKAPPHRKKHHKNKNKEMVPPSKPVVTRLSDSSVMVRWHVPPNQGLPIFFFKVQYRELRRGKSWMTVDEDISPYVNSYEVTNLTPNADYKFRIAAVYSNNDNMLGSTSPKFHLHSGMSPRLVPHSPRLTHLVPAGPNAIKIFWEYNSSEPVADGFYIYYRSTSSAGDYLMATVEGEEVRNFVVNHLDPETAYEFKLQSFTTNAASDFSEILTQKTESPATERPPTTVSSVRTDIESDSKSGNQLYVVLGAVLGGLALLLALCTWIFCCNKHRQHHPAGNEDDDVDKSRHIQMETIHVNGHVGTHMANHLGGNSRESGVLVNKTSSNGCCNKMNITSNPLDADEKTQNVMEIAFITSNTCDDSCSSSVLTARLASATVLPTCGMESEPWRRADIPRTVDNYV